MKLLVSFIAHCFKQSPTYLIAKSSNSLHALHENPIYVFPEQELRDLSPISIFMCLWAFSIFPE